MTFIKRCNDVKIMTCMIILSNTMDLSIEYIVFLVMMYGTCYDHMQCSCFLYFLHCFFGLACVVANTSANKDHNN